MKVFEKLKTTWLINLVLKMFLIKLPLRIKIDALNLAIKACALQSYKGKWHSIEYLSRKLLSIKQNYDIHDKKLLAIVVTLKL